MAKAFTNTEKRYMIDTYVHLQNYYKYRGTFCPSQGYPIFPITVEVPVEILVCYGLSAKDCLVCKKLVENNLFWKDVPPDWETFVASPHLLEDIIQIRKEYKKKGFPEWEAERSNPLMRLNDQRRALLVGVPLYDASDLQRSNPELFENYPLQRPLDMTVLTEVSVAASANDTNVNASAMTEQGDSKDERGRVNLKDHEGDSELINSREGEESRSPVEVEWLDVLNDAIIKGDTELTQRLLQEISQKHGQNLNFQTDRQSQQKNGHQDKRGQSEPNPREQRRVASQVAVALNDDPRVRRDANESVTGGNQGKDVQIENLEKTMLAMLTNQNELMKRLNHEPPAPIPRNENQVRFQEQNRLPSPIPPNNGMDGQPFHENFNRSPLSTGKHREDREAREPYFAPPSNSDVRARYGLRHSSPLTERFQQGGNREENAREFSQFNPYNEGYDPPGQDGENFGATAYRQRNQGLPRGSVAGSIYRSSLSNRGETMLSRFGDNMDPASSVWVEDGCIPLVAGLNKWDGIPLPRFKGDRHEWKAFRSQMILFLSSKNANTRLAQMHFIMGALKGEISNEYMTQIENKGEDWFDVNQFWLDLDARYKEDPKEQYLSNPERYLIEYPWDGKAHSFDAKVAAVEFRLRKGVRNMPSCEPYVRITAATLMRDNIPIEMKRELEQRRRMTQIDPFENSETLRYVVADMFKEYKALNDDIPWDENWHKKGKHFPKVNTDKKSDKEKKDNNANKYDKSEESSSLTQEKTSQKKDYEKVNDQFSKGPPGQQDWNRNKYGHRSEGQTDAKGQEDKASGPKEDRNSKSVRFTGGDEKEKPSHSRSLSRADREKLYCNYCNKTGHEENDCWRKHFEQSRKQGDPKKSRDPRDSKEKSDTSDPKKPTDLRSLRIESPDSQNENKRTCVKCNCTKVEESFNEDGVPMVPVNFGDPIKRTVLISGYPVSAMIDMGAGITAVSRSVAAKLVGKHQEGGLNQFVEAGDNESHSTAAIVPPAHAKAEIVPPAQTKVIQLITSTEPMKLICGNGAKWMIHEELINTEITLGSRTIPMNLWVYPDGENQYDCILGINFMKYIGYSVIDPDGRSEWHKESVERAIKSRPPDTPRNEIMTHMTPKGHLLKGLECPQLQRLGNQNSAVQNTVEKIDVANTAHNARTIECETSQRSSAPPEQINSHMCRGFQSFPKTGKTRPTELNRQVMVRRLERMKRCRSHSPVPNKSQEQVMTDSEPTAHERSTSGKKSGEKESMKNKHHECQPRSKTLTECNLLLNVAGSDQCLRCKTPEQNRVEQRPVKIQRKHIRFKNRKSLNGRKSDRNLNDCGNTDHLSVPADHLSDENYSIDIPEKTYAQVASMACIDRTAKARPPKGANL